MARSVAIASHFFKMISVSSRCLCHTSLLCNSGWPVGRDPAKNSPYSRSFGIRPSFILWHVQASADDVDIRVDAGSMEQPAWSRMSELGTLSDRGWQGYAGDSDLKVKLSRRDFCLEYVVQLSISTVTRRKPDILLAWCSRSAGCWTRLS